MTTLHTEDRERKGPACPRLGQTGRGGRSIRCSAEVSKDGVSASGDSIMGLLMLAASKGTYIDVETSGPDARSTWPRRSRPWWPTSSAKAPEAGRKLISEGRTSTFGRSLAKYDRKRLLPRQRAFAKYDRRSLTYASLRDRGSRRSSGRWKWLTGKITILRLIREFEAAGARRARRSGARRWTSWAST